MSTKSGTYTRTDRQTDGRTDGRTRQKLYAPLTLVRRGIKIAISISNQQIFKKYQYISSLSWLTSKSVSLGLYLLYIYIDYVNVSRTTQRIVGEVLWDTTPYKEVYTLMVKD